MPEEHILFLTKEEIKALAELCETAIRMSDIPFFQRMEIQAKSALQKFEDKIGDIDG